MLTRVLERVYGIEMPVIARPSQEIERVKSELKGLPLPPAVIEWMVLAQRIRNSPEILADSYWAHTLRVEAAPANEALVINCWRGCAQWAVPYPHLGQDDPPLWAYDYSRKQASFVHRKTYGQAPMTHYALHWVLNYTPWLDGWVNWGTMGSRLKDTKAFIESVRASGDGLVSEAFGSVTFVEGPGWIAFAVKGWTPWGKDQGTLRLRMSEGVDRRSIPKPICELVELRR